MELTGNILKPRDSTGKTIWISSISGVTWAHSPTRHHSTIRDMSSHAPFEWGLTHTFSCPVSWADSHNLLTPVDTSDFAMPWVNGLKSPFTSWHSCGCPFSHGTMVASPTDGTRTQPTASPGESVWSQRSLAHYRTSSEHIQTLDSDQLFSPQCHLLPISALDVAFPVWTFQEI